MSKTIQPRASWLEEEQVRNRVNNKLYTDMIREAYGADFVVLIGHHLCYQKDGRIETLDEIPAADTMMFDHDIMFALFGNSAPKVMTQLALTPISSRDEVLSEYFYSAGRI